MANIDTTQQHGHQHSEEHSFDTKAIWRTFWILLGITCVELIVGMFIAPHFHAYKLWFNIFYVILTAAKAFYIIAEFMHLRHEIKNLIMCIAVPALLFIWFIAAFLWDGDSYKQLRNQYDPYHKEHTTTPAKHAPAPHGEDATKPGAVH